jgi:hypothetical protein
VQYIAMSILLKEKPLHDQHGGSSLPVEARTACHQVDEPRCGVFPRRVRQSALRRHRQARRATTHFHPRLLCQLVDVLPALNCKKFESMEIYFAENISPSFLLKAIHSIAHGIRAAASSSARIK